MTIVEIKPDCRSPQPVCDSRHAKVGWPGWMDWKVLLDGREVLAVEACATQGWAVVYVVDENGHALPNADGTAVVTELVYGHVEIRRSE